MRLFDGEVDVAYMQFYVETPDQLPGEDVERRVAGQVNGLCGAGEPGMLHCTTGLHTGLVPVTVDLLDAAPAEADDGWEEIVEVSWTTTTPSVLLYDWDHQQPIELALGDAGSFRVRYHARGMDTGRDADVRRPGEPVLDRYLLQFWPAPPAPDTVLRLTSDIARYWHDTARATPAPGSPAAGAQRDDDEARLAAFHALIQAISTSDPELQRAIARWLVRRTATVVGPAAAAWAQPALDALEHGRPLPAPFDDRASAIAAAHRDLAAPTGDDHDNAGQEATGAPGAALSLVGALLHAADPDPSVAVLGALTAAQYATDRPETELHNEVRVRFLT